MWGADVSMLDMNILDINMLGANIWLGIIGLSAGVIVAGGLFSFIIGLGVISDFADRTHTGEHVLLYEDSVAIGGMLGNIVWLYQISLPDVVAGILGEFCALFFGLLSGIFVGCWAMALAEMLDVFPIFIRRFKVIKYVPYMILAMAVGKGIGAIVFFVNRW